MDVHVEQVGNGVVLGIEEFFVEKVAREGFALPESEQLDEGILTRGQLHGFSGEPDDARGGVDFHSVDGHGGRMPCAAAPQQSA